MADADNEAWLWDADHPDLVLAAQAQQKVEEGIELALAGRIGRAGATFEEAQAISPYPDYDLVAEGYRRAARLHVQRGVTFALDGDLEAALVDFAKAQALIPSSEMDAFDLELTGRYLAMQALSQAGIQLVLEGDIPAAKERFQDAERLNLEGDGDAYVAGIEDAKWSLGLRLEEELAGGEIDAARRTLALFQELDPADEIPASIWNNICRYGALSGLAAEVLDDCRRAVRSAVSAEEEAAYRDSRGIARALTGNRLGAIADFRFVVETWSEQSWRASSVATREAWIADLEDGGDPFDEETLAVLRGG